MKIQGSGSRRGPKSQNDSLNRARVRNQNALAGLNELELRKRRGELLEADDVEKAWTSTARMIRSGVLGIVGRVRAELPDLAPTIVATIDREARAALEALANDVAPR